MNEPVAHQYDDIVAAHYAAYRPPLHRLILDRVLSDERESAVGLDVGCGTGYSALALARHARRVVGVEPSPHMLQRATPHRGVRYVAGAAERLPLADRSVDIATFAGSLFYADRRATAEELGRVCRLGALVVVYDFEVRLSGVLCRYGMSPVVATDYDHSVNFSGTLGFAELAVTTERVTVRTTAAEQAHVLLADAARVDGFTRHFGVPDPFSPLVIDLTSTVGTSSVEADTYYAKYRLAPV